MMGIYIAPILGHRPSSKRFTHYLTHSLNGLPTQVEPAEEQPTGGSFSRFLYYSNISHSFSFISFIPPVSHIGCMRCLYVSSISTGTQWHTVTVDSYIYLSNPFFFFA